MPTVLIVESNPALAALWARHVRRQGLVVVTADNADRAIDIISATDIALVVLDLDLDGGVAEAVAAYTGVRLPDARVLFVTASSFFSDGTVFVHNPNACACVPSATPPADLAAMVHHYSQPV